MVLLVLEEVRAESVRVPGPDQAVLPTSLPVARLDVMISTVGLYLYIEYLHMIVVCYQCT